MNILRYLSGTILGMMVLACLNICWSCSEDKEEVLPPAIELTTQGVEMKALGGDASVLVNVANAVEGVELKAECSTTWITDLHVEGYKVSFSVQPNTADEERETTITLSYTGAESKTLKVMQKGMGNIFYQNALWIGIERIKPHSAIGSYIITHVYNCPDSAAPGSPISLR